MQVVALIHEENGVYEASFPGFPGCRTSADDPDTVIARAEEALALHIERMIREGRELPQERSLAQLAIDPDFLAGSPRAMIALVPYAPAARSVRLSVRLDELLLTRIDRAAKAAGETRSEFLAEAARRRLADAGTGAGDAARPAQTPLARPAEAPGQQQPVLADAAQADHVTSLKAIKDMLDRMDPACVPQQYVPLLRPAKGANA